MIVEVENIGKLEFPDNTNPDVIKETVKRLVGEKESDEPGFMEKYLPSVKRVGEIYGQEVSQGLEAMERATQKPTGRNIIQGFLGALQYGFSPLTAGVKGIVREPVEQGLKDVGVPEGAAEFAGEMVEAAAYFVPYGKAVQMAIKGQKAMAELKTVQQAIVQAKSIKPKTTSKPLEFPKELADDVIQDAVKPISEANQKILKTTAVDDVVEQLKPAMQQWDPTQKRITQEIVDYMVGNPKEIEKIASAYKLSPGQLAAQMKETMTLAGRDLGRMGKLAKELKKKYQTDYMRQLSASIEKDLPEIAVLDKFMNKWKTVENVRRSALVSQFATTARNIISQAGRLTLGSIDDAFQGAANAFLKSGGEVPLNSAKSTLRAMGEGLDTWTATINRMRPKERKKLVEILGTQNAINAKSQLFTTPVQDVVLTSKISKTLNYFNTTQEYFFRNIAFEAKLRQLSRQAGIDFKNLKGVDLPEEMLNQAASHALEMTFAAAPTSKFGQQWVKFMSNPIMTSFINPFPRFLYGNALPFLKNFSPIGFLEAASPKTVAGIVSGNPEKFSKAISRATLGTIMLNTANHIRSSEYGGEKWYELKFGDKRLDTRAFAPFSTYLFIAETMQNPEKIKPADYGSALLSLNRIGGTGLVLADVLRSRSAETTVNVIKRLGGEYMAGFTVPARTVKDIYSAVDPEEAIIRDVKGDEFFGPSKRNLIGISQTLPKRKSPLKVGDLKSETPLLRQFTGLSYRTKNELEKEVALLDLPYSRIYPRTGDAEGDRKVSQIMAAILEKAYPLLTEKTQYKQMDEITRKIILSKLFSDAKKDARNLMMQIDPDIAIKIKIDSIPKDVQKLMELRGILPK